MIKVTVSKGTSNRMVSLDPWSKAFSATSCCHTEKEVARLKGTGHITLKRVQRSLGATQWGRRRLPQLVPWTSSCPTMPAIAPQGCKQNHLRWCERETSLPPWELFPTSKFRAYLWRKSLINASLPKWNWAAAHQSLLSKICATQGFMGSTKRKDCNIIFISLSPLVLAIVLQSGRLSQNNFLKIWISWDHWKPPFMELMFKEFPLGLFCVFSPRACSPNSIAPSKIYDSFSLPGDPSLQKTSRKERVRF